MQKCMYISMHTYCRLMHLHIQACFFLLNSFKHIQLHAGSLRSLNKSIFSPDQFSVDDWVEHPNMSEWVNEPNASNKADVSKDHQCQICHRNHIAKRQWELTHEIVHNLSIIAICHSIDFDNVASYIDQQCWEDESCSLPMKCCKSGLTLDWYSACIKSLRYSDNSCWDVCWLKFCFIMVVHSCHIDTRWAYKEDTNLFVLFRGLSVWCSTEVPDWIGLSDNGVFSTAFFFAPFSLAQFCLNLLKGKACLWICFHPLESLKWTLDFF